MKKIISILLLMMILVSPAFATSYFMNSSTGSNSYNGLSATYTSGTTGPWASATPFEGTNFLKPGDSVTIASGTTYTGTNCNMTINSSGVNGLPITIQGDGLGANPIFNCATNTSAVVGWTGWNFYQGSFTLTIPSNTVSANCIYSTPNGNQFTVKTAISSQTSLNLTGTNGLPSAASSNLTYVSGSGTCPSPISYSAVTTNTATYVSQTTVPFTVQGVIIDQTSNLIYRSSYLLGLNVVRNLYYQSAGYLYVNLSDNSAPSGHTIELVGLYGPTGANGVIQTAGNYITFNDIEVYGAIGSGYLVNNGHININNSSAYFAGYATFYCADNGYQSPGCTNSTFLNDIGEYGNGSNSDGNNGENVVIEGSYNTWNGGTIAYGAMAGIDVIGYPGNGSFLAPASYNVVENATIEYNSQRSLQSADSGGYDPPGLYCDGCNNLQAINDSFIGNSNNSTFPVAGQNRTGNIVLSTEHPSTNIPHDVYIHNCTSSQSNLTSLTVTVLNPTTTWTVSPANATSGATYTNNGVTYTVTSTISGGTTLSTSGTPGDTTLPTGSTLTKATGTGDATITFSAYTTTGLPWYNVWVDGSTFYGDSNDGGYLVGFGNFNLTYGRSLHLYNNIFYQNSGSSGAIGLISAVMDSNNNDYYGQNASIIAAGGTNYTLSGWQTLSGEDANSISSNPYIVSTTAPYNFHLQRTASGQANNSPAIGIANGTWQNTYYNITSNGTTNTTGAIDTSNTDAGYHYSMVYASSVNWPPVAPYSGSDFGAQ